MRPSWLKNQKRKLLEHSLVTSARMSKPERRLVSTVSFSRKYSAEQRVKKTMLMCSLDEMVPDPWPQT